MLLLRLQALDKAVDDILPVDEVEEEASPFDGAVVLG